MHAPTVTTATVHLTVPQTTHPTLPPKPEQDALDGYLDAYLAQPVKPHRDRLVDILRVIHGTQTGRELLDHFRARASANNVLMVNLLAPGAEVPDSAAAHDVWLKKEALTGHAQETGVSAETTHAPSVFQSLAMARAAALARDYIESSKQDLAAMQAQFRAELAAGGGTLSARVDSAATIEALRLDAQRARSVSKLSPGRDAHTAPADPRPDGETPDNPLSARRATLTLGTQENDALGVPKTDAKEESRPLSAPSSLIELTVTAAAAAAAPVPSESTPLVESDSVKNEGDVPRAPKRVKSARRRLTQWVSRPFQAIEGLLARRRLTWARSGKPAGVPKASVYQSNGITTTSRTSSIVNSMANPLDGQIADRAGLADVKTANRDSRVEATTASTTNLAQAQGAAAPGLVETQAAGKGSLAQAPAATTSSPAEV